MIEYTLGLEDGQTYMKVAVDLFNDWYGDKSYRHEWVAGEIQEAVVTAVTAELVARLLKMHDSEYAQCHDDFQRGINAALREVQELHLEIRDTKIPYDPYGDDE